jgi:hypothetical protein
MPSTARILVPFTPPHLPSWRRIMPAAWLVDKLQSARGHVGRAALVAAPRPEQDFAMHTLTEQCLAP